MANDLLTLNPFHGVKLVKPKVERKARVPFDSDDITAARKISNRSL